MTLLRHHDDDARAGSFAVDVPVHRERFADARESIAQVVEIERSIVGLKVHAHEEATGVAVAELLTVEDVAVVFGEEARDRVHDSDSVRTRQREDEAVHEAASSSVSVLRLARLIARRAGLRWAPRRRVSQNSA